MDLVYVFVVPVFFFFFNSSSSPFCPLSIMASSVHKLQRKWHRNNWPCCRCYCCCCCCCLWKTMCNKSNKQRAGKKLRIRQVRPWPVSAASEASNVCNACKTIILTRQKQRQAANTAQCLHCATPTSLDSVWLGSLVPDASVLALRVTHWPVVRLAAFWLLCTLILIFNWGSIFPESSWKRTSFSSTSSFFIFLSFTLHLTEIHFIVAPFSIIYSKFKLFIIWICWHLLEICWPRFLTTNIIYKCSHLMALKYLLKSILKSL